jgi:uncharacterized protein
MDLEENILLLFFSNLANMRLYTRFLYKKRSKIPKSGNGLFTSRFIPKNSIIIEYCGPKIKLADLCFSNPNYFGLTDDVCIDGSNCIGRYANDADGISKQFGCINNCKFITRHHKIFIVSIYDIPPKEELFIAYGHEYWKQVIKNMNKDL